MQCCVMHRFVPLVDNLVTLSSAFNEVVERLEKHVETLAPSSEQPVHGQK